MVSVITSCGKPVYRVGCGKPGLRALKRSIKRTSPKISPTSKFSPEEEFLLKESQKVGSLSRKYNLKSLSRKLFASFARKKNLADLFTPTCNAPSFVVEIFNISNFNVFVSKTSSQKSQYKANNINVDDDMILLDPCFFPPCLQFNKVCIFFHQQLNH